MRLPCPGDVFTPLPATALAERTLFAYGPQTYGGGTCRHRCGARSSKPVAGFTVCGRFDSYASPPESILPYISKKFWFQKTGTEKPLEASASRGFLWNPTRGPASKGCRCLMVRAVISKQHVEEKTARTALHGDRRGRVGAGCLSL